MGNPDAAVDTPRPDTFTAASASGALAVRTTERGRPVRLKVRQDELYRHPNDLAAEIMYLCRRAANRGALLRRTELEAAGLSGPALALTGLPTREDVARDELAYEQQYGAEPQIWSRST